MHRQRRSLAEGADIRMKKPAVPHSEHFEDMHAHVNEHGYCHPCRAPTIPKVPRKI